MPEAVLMGEADLVNHHVADAIDVDGVGGDGDNDDYDDDVESAA